MPKIKEVDPPTLPTAPPSPPKKCEVSTNLDGSLAITFQVDAQVAKRLLLRANGMDIERYIWENILHRTVTDHVY